LNWGEYSRICHPERSQSIRFRMGWRSRRTPSITPGASVLTPISQELSARLYFPRIAMAKIPTIADHSEGGRGSFDSEIRFASEAVLSAQDDRALLTELLARAYAGAKFVSDFVCRLSGCLFLGDAERDRSHAGVTSAAVAFAHLGQVYRWFGGRPRI
jgi:hypothetical protein